MTRQRLAVNALDWRFARWMGGICGLKSQRSSLAVRLFDTGFPFFCCFSLHSIHSKEIFHSVSISFSRCWEFLLWMDPANCGGVKGKLPSSLLYGAVSPTGSIMHQIFHIKAAEQEENKNLLFVRTEASRRRTGMRMETKRTVRLKRRTKRRKTMATERLTRWRRRSRATGTSCSTCLRLLPVRNTSSWSSPVILKSSPHTLMICFFSPLSWQFFLSLSIAAYIAAVYHSMKEELRRNAPGATPIKRRGGSQASQQPLGDLSALPGTTKPGVIPKSPSWQMKHSSRCSLSNRNDHLLSGICVHGAHAEHFHHHSEDPEKGDGHEECEPALRAVPRPAWVPPAAQQPGTGVRQICLPGTSWSGEADPGAAEMNVPF